MFSKFLGLYTGYTLQDLKKMYFDDFMWLYEMTAVINAETNLQMLTVFEHQLLANSSEGMQEYPKLSKEYRSTISQYLKTREIIFFDKSGLQNLKARLGGGE